MTEQTTYPLLGTPWNPGPPDATGYVPPVRSLPLLSPERLRRNRDLVVPDLTVVGTVRDELPAFERSWAVWSKQTGIEDLNVEYLVLDDGSLDGIEELIRGRQREGARIRYVRFRNPGDPGDRSCTVLFNAALETIVRSPLVMFQWYDRIPGSFRHLAALTAPHRERAGIATSAISRHIGGSSSVDGLQPEALAAMLGLVPWRERPETLSRIAGKIGDHCVPGRATESSGLCIGVKELEALGGWDERYGASRHGYPNVDLFRRVVGAGIPVLFPSQHAENYHQSHPQARGNKDTSLLSDVTLVRNGGPDGAWGEVGYVHADLPTPAITG